MPWKIFFQCRIFFAWYFLARIFFPSKSVCRIFFSEITNIVCTPPQKSNGQPLTWSCVNFHPSVSFVLDFHAKWPYNSINICKQSNVFIIVYSKHFSFASPSSLAIIIWRALFSSIKCQFLTLFSSRHETSDTHSSTSVDQRNVAKCIMQCRKLMHYSPCWMRIEVGSLFSKSCNLLNINVIL